MNITHAKVLYKQIMRSLMNRTMETSNNGKDINGIHQLSIKSRIFPLDISVNISVFFI